MFQILELLLVILLVNYTEVVIMSFDWQLYGKKPTSIAGYIGWLYYTYCITTGLYMLDSWERTVFSK